MDKNARFMEIIENIQQLPALGSDSIHIWGVHVPDLLDRLDFLHFVLSEKEQEKAARYRKDTDRQSSVAARGALRILLSGYTGIPAAEIAFHYSENGKPFLVSPDSGCFSAEHGRQDACDTLSFNLSHSVDWVVLAFGRDRNIGVDVEKIKRDTDILPIATRFFAPDEVALIENAADQHTMFFQLWARKEAYVKAVGSTLFRELSGFSVPMGELAEKDGWFFHRLEAGSNYAAAVVTDKPGAYIPCYDFGGLKWDS